jgi:hypothetical protein
MFAFSHKNSAGKGVKNTQMDAPLSTVSAAGLARGAPTCDVAEDDARLGHSIPVHNTSTQERTADDTGNEMPQGAGVAADDGVAEDGLQEQEPLGIARECFFALV